MVGLKFIASMVLLPQALAFFGRVDNPAPTLSSISPAKVAAGTSSQVLVVSGHNFLSSSSVLFNGEARAATFVNSTKLTLNLRSTDLYAPGSFTVIIVNPPPGGGSSAPAHLMVQPANSKQLTRGSY